MSFDISKLTSAVNKYLNSISDVSAATQRASEEIEQRTRFKAELSDAIQQNIESRMRQQEQMPDIADSVRSQVQQAVGTIDATFEQVNGAFEEIRNAGKVTSANEAAASGSDTSGGAKSANYDAYNGLLSTEALQELSKSQYFSANLIQGSLFSTEEDQGTSGRSTFTDTLTSALESASGTASKTSSPFDSISLSDLNTNSLTAGGTQSETSSSDLAKALIKAYTQNASTASATSIFGDFTL